ncbi:MAG: hypothetical protein F6K47_01575 [Symploca sp. SIO2E6]|nr:hypothetical protein [Symploca sp. SIO2E6]
MSNRRRDAGTLLIEREKHYFLTPSTSYLTSCLGASCKSVSREVKKVSTLVFKLDYP